MNVYDLSTKLSYEVDIPEQTIKNAYEEYLNSNQPKHKGPDLNFPQTTALEQHLTTPTDWCPTKSYILVITHWRN